MGPSIDDTLDLFATGKLDAFNAFLSSVPEDQKPVVMSALVDRSYQKYSEREAQNLCRRIGQHPSFASYWTELPFTLEQGIFFSNLPFLKTRLSMSFFDHRSVTRPAIDYSLILYDMNGVKVFEKSSTLGISQTHTLELSDCGLAANRVPFGLACIRTTEPILNSLRFYAQWYNENSITTTHEKGYLGNGSDLLTYPTIVSDAKHDTFMAISNIRWGKNIILNCTLQNDAQETHPSVLRAEVKSRSSVFLPVSQYFGDIRNFLGGRAGALYIKPDGPGGLYYYFIHNTELKTWQAQHL